MSRKAFRLLLLVWDLPLEFFSLFPLFRVGPRLVCKPMCWMLGLYLLCRFDLLSPGSRVSARSDFGLYWSEIA